MKTIQIKSSLSIEELIESLSQLDTPTLNQVVTSLRKEQQTREKEAGSLTMPEDEFWLLIDQINWKTDDKEVSLQPLVKALSGYPAAKIYQFSERLALLLSQLDGPDYVQPLERGELGFSADTFLYARCYVVAKGEKFYKKVLEKPSEMPVGKELEALLYVAEEAYREKTGKRYHYVPSVNYESFFNRDLWGENAISI